jgi:urea-proton symporter
MLGMGYIYLMMGCIISSAVIPATLTLTWDGQNWIAAAGAPVLGLACALIAWLVTAQKQCGGLTVECTGSNYPMLAGNVTALLSPVIFIPVLTFAFGQQKYDWHSMAAINQGDDSDIAAKLNIDVESIRGQAITTEMILDEAEQKHLKKSAIIARSMTVFMTVAFLVLWPMPLYGTGYIFSKKFFTGTSSFVPPRCTRHPFSLLCPFSSDFDCVEDETDTQIQVGWWSESCGYSFPPSASGCSRSGKAARRPYIR